MRSSLRDVMLSFGVGAGVALTVGWFALALAPRFPCSNDCTASVASTRTPAQLADDGVPRGRRPAHREAAAAPAERGGGGVLVAMAPEATPSGTAPSSEEATPATTGAPAAAAPAPTATREDEGAAPRRLDGSWMVTNAADSSDRRTPTGQVVVYRIELQQDGARLGGKGSTWSKNGRVLAPSQRTPVVATGTWHDDRLELLLIEHATHGTRQVRLEWQPTAQGDAFAGHFASEATYTMGRSEAVRASGAPVDEAKEEPARSPRHAPRIEPRRLRHHAD